MLEASVSSADGEQILGTVSAMASSGISSPNLVNALEVERLMNALKAIQEPGLIYTVMAKRSKATTALVVY